VGVDLPSGSHLLKIWVMNLWVLVSLRERREDLGSGCFNLKNFGVIIGGSPRVAPEGGSDSAGESRGSLSKEK